MKRFVFFTIGVICCLAFLNGCSEDDSNTQYYYEFFRILKTDFNKVTIPTPPNLTFYAIKNYRDSLRSYSTNFMESGTDATEDDIYELLTSRGKTPSEANIEISFLNTVGNNIFVFVYTLNTTEWVILYLEKL